jgi:AraC family transcriptional regulator
MAFNDPLIQLQPQVDLVGMPMQMSLQNDQTPLLWRTFMQQKNRLPALQNRELFSVNIFNEAFNYLMPEPQKVFTKWAAVQAGKGENLAAPFQHLSLPGGLYAVFKEMGAASRAKEIFTWIFSGWMPDSGYIADHRPHYEILPENYRHSPDTAEELIFIPIRKKS